MSTGPWTLSELPAAAEGDRGWPWEEEAGGGPEPVTGNSFPRITIVTPSFNQGRFLEQAIRSVLLQGYPDLEYYVMDGGSTDGSREILERYATYLSGWECGPDRGQSHAISKGFEAGTGDILGWVNSDDLLMPGALLHVADMFRSHPDAVAWVGRCRLVDADGREIRIVTPRGLERESIADWGRAGFFYQPSCFFSADAYRQVGGLDEELTIAMDFDLWVRLARMGTFAGTDALLSAATRHSAMKTRANRAGMHAETAMVQIRHGYPRLAVERLTRVLEGKPKGKTPFWSRLRAWARKITGRSEV